MKPKAITVMMSAGEYYLGDPCYVLREEQHPGFSWSRDFCNPLWKAEEKGKHTLFVLGEEIVALSTFCGDGVYRSNIEKEFPVDAGLIGLVPKSLWKDTEHPFGCTLVAFDKDFTVYGNSDGVLVFGHIKIYTGDDLEDEEIWEGDDEAEED